MGNRFRVEAHRSLAERLAYPILDIINSPHYHRLILGRVNGITSADMTLIDIRISD